MRSKSSWGIKYTGNKPSWCGSFLVLHSQSPSGICTQDSSRFLSNFSCSWWKYPTNSKFDPRKFDKPLGGGPFGQPDSSCATTPQGPRFCQGTMAPKSAGPSRCLLLLQRSFLWQIGKKNKWYFFCVWFIQCRHYMPIYMMYSYVPYCSTW